MSSDTTSRSVVEGVDRLKELLFDSEAETLHEVQRRLGALEGLSESEKRARLDMLRRLDQLFNRAGTEERFSTSIAVVLDQALREAELRNHTALAQAMAPLVINTIKTEIRNSQDEMVEILHPLTGRMVQAYVTSAMKDLISQINQRIDQNPMMLRMRSWTTGKSVAELAIADRQRLQVQEVFLIRRGSGELLAHWPYSNTPSNADIHMSGVLAAINEFAATAFAEEGGNFRSFEFDDLQVFLRASPAYLLAARCDGIAPGGVERIFDEEFIATLERLGDLERATDSRLEDVAPRERAQELQPFATSVEERTGAIYDENQSSGIGSAVLKAALFLIAVPLLAWFFWGLYTDAEETSVERSALQVLAGIPEMNGYPADLDVGYRGLTLTLSGLAPDEATLAELTGALRKELPNTSVTARLAVLPTTRFDSGPFEARVNRRLSAIKTDLAREGARRSLQRSQDRMQQAAQALAGLESSNASEDQRADLREVGAVLRELAGQLGELRGKLNSGDDGRAAPARHCRCHQTKPCVPSTVRSKPSARLPVRGHPRQARLRRMPTRCLARSKILLPNRSALRP